METRLITGHVALPHTIRIVVRCLYERSWGPGLQVAFAQLPRTWSQSDRVSGRHVRAMGLRAAGRVASRFEHTVTLMFLRSVFAVTTEM